MLTNTTQTEAARYGQLAAVAINFHIATGNPAELDAAYWYARYAARAYDREFTPARKDQGFKSQAHLDAFYAQYDHTKACEDCKRRDSYVLLDDGYQPTVGQCDVAQELTRVYFQF